jgi:hypothetical protein
MYRASTDTGGRTMGKLYAYPPMHHHLISQPTGQPMTPAAKQSTLPEASSFSSSLTDPKAEHTLKSQELDRDVPKSSFKRKPKSESLEYTDLRVTAEKPNLPELQAAWTPARLGQTATQTFYCMSFASARVSEVLSVLDPSARSK